MLYSLNTAFLDGNAQQLFHMLYSGYSNNFRCCTVKYIMYTNAFFCRALDVIKCTNLICRVLCITCRHWLLPLACKFLDKRSLSPSIRFAAHKNIWNSRTKMPNFRHPLFLNAFQRIWLNNAIAYHNNVSIWIGQRSQSIVVC